VNKRAFCNKIEVIHQEWLSNTFGLHRTGNKGIDMWSDAFSTGGQPMYFELKCRKRKNMNECWEISETQIKRYQKEHGPRNIFWIFLIYTLGEPINKIRDVSEELVTSRMLYIIPWRWIHNFEKSQGEYDTYRYPKEKDIRNIRLTYADSNGTAIYHGFNKRIRTIVKHATATGGDVF